MVFASNPAYGFVRIAETGRLVALDSERELEAFAALCRLWNIRHEIIVGF